MKKLALLITLFIACIIIFFNNVQSSIRIVTPSSSDYNKERACLNKKFDLYPSIIYFCQTAVDVKQAIEAAKKLGKKIRVRSGRHSYEAFSNGNDIAIIDVSPIHTFKLSDDKKTVTIGAGLTLIDIYSKLWKNKLTIPGGSCPDVGISGLVLGGGVGFSSRKMGLACDSAIEFEIVTATGKILTVTRNNEYSDLFWACCGAGNGNWGIITSIKFKTHPVDDKVTVYHIDLDWDKLNQSSEAWFTILKNAPRELMLFLRFIKSGNQKILSSFGQFFGTPEKLQELLQPLLRFAINNTTKIKEVDYMAAIKHWAGRDTVAEYFKASSLFLTDTLSKQALKEIDQFFSNPKIKDAFLVIDSYGGAIKDIDINSSAFVHRDKLASIQTMVIWTDNNQRAEQEQLFYAFRKSLADAGTGAYINYPDINLTNWQSLYYGNHYARLQNIKAKYDPNNLFTYEQAIELPKH